MPDPVYFDKDFYKWNIQHGGNSVVLSDRNKSCKKTGNTNQWDCLCVCELKNKVAKIKVKIINTKQSDKSGLCVGIVGSNNITKANQYGQTISLKYSCSHNVYPHQGDILEFRVNQGTDMVEIYRNGIKGTCYKKPSSFQKPLYIAAFLYYQNNEVQFVK